jgi:phosphopantetheine adenylyltransferase
LVSLHGHSNKFDHALAILAMPTTSVDRIANAVVLETAVPRCRKLSVVLKCEGRESPSLSQLRAYVGEVYSQLWDCVVNNNDDDDESKSKSDPSHDELVDVVVYPANLPNAAPESWITIQKDLDCICSHSNFMGWFSTGSGRGQSYAMTDGWGGLEEHVAAVNRERRERQLRPVAALGVDEKHWPMPASAAAYLRDQHVIFLEDDIPAQGSMELAEAVNGDEVETELNVFLGGAKPDNATLFENVAVGGTFDGMHYGHRKLLTLAVSATNPLTGKLLIGVTADKMLQHKHLADLIRPFDVRRKSVLDFLGRLAPGMLNRVKVVEINDAFGPPAHDPGFDALVLSHETLETGCLLNKHRVAHGLPPLALLCTRRTEAHGMSSTALRKAAQQQRSQEQRRQQQTW